MKQLLIFLSAIISTTMLEGCATDRLVDVRVNRIERNLADTKSFDLDLAFGLFKSVADQLQYGIDGPHSLSQNGGFTYFAYSQNKIKSNKARITLWVDPQYFSYQISQYGHADETTSIHQVANLFEHELEKRGIEYRTSTRTGSFLNN